MTEYCLRRRKQLAAAGVSQHHKDQPPRNKEKLPPHAQAERRLHGRLGPGRETTEEEARRRSEERELGRLKEREREQKREGQALLSVYRQLLADLVLVDEGDAALGNGSLLAALAYDVPEFLRVLLHTTHTEAGAAREGGKEEAHTASVPFFAYARAPGTHRHAQEASLSTGIHLPVWQMYVDNGILAGKEIGWEILSLLLLPPLLLLQQ